MYAMEEIKIRVGLCGTGFIAHGLALLFSQQSRYQLVKVLSRRPESHFVGLPYSSLITTNVDELLEHCDVLVECSGDPFWAAQVVNKAFAAECPVLTMNAEFQLLAGTYFERRGVLHESEGDQPGSLAALDREVRLMGFKPLVYGAQKSFLETDPDEKTMRYWAKFNCQSLANTVSFTDGTKVQIEMALVANGLGADMLKPGLVGPSCTVTRDGALALAQHAKAANKLIVDYVLNPGGQGEVFIVCEHDMQQSSLTYFKLGQGPFYYLNKPYHLGHIEIIKSLDNIIAATIKPFNNGASPSKSVAAIAKRTLRPGTRIKNGIGCFDVRGEMVEIKDVPDHIPIALLHDAVVQRFVEPGEMLSFADIEVQDGLAATAWRFTRDRALAVQKESALREVL